MQWGRTQMRTRAELKVKASAQAGVARGNGCANLGASRREGAAAAAAKSRRRAGSFVSSATATEADLSKYQTVGDRYLVTLLEREAKTDGGILLSAQAAENQAQGEKLLVGTVQGVPEESSLDVKVGDSILFAKYGATETMLDDRNVYFVRTGEVLAVLE
ncbi:putative GroES-like chaperonin [Chloropicon primus]|uniref:Putative GroES-like chaperonin n=1 Tax=Chloropicon primus TaxID=1764295 RepID=A0A5B8ME47_9CHLO|nr:putative GroES-like chaperonin [Chloropicon primus]UPQ97911.1 putative GroES-like chaperonin [Chloropicon primus]|eukprot:QDZ18703.1 putative GroES-like chaperonin [Chloropicon primus]